MALKSSASIQTEISGNEGLTLIIEGSLDSATTGRIWREAEETLEKRTPLKIIVDATKIDYCDGSGTGFFVELYRRQQGAGGEVEIRGLRPEFKKLLDLFDPSVFREPRKEKPKHLSVPYELGLLAYHAWQDIRELITFTGELCVAMFYAALNPRRIRWKDAFLIAETAGVNALPIIALVSFLVGLIIAFQSAIPMKQFAAEIFVANLVALSMLRELGPLMTAIILAGRSGSAFAAELGTMKVREEIDALTTMGLDPVRFLAVTRVIASLVMTPLLTIFANLFGLIGGAVVFLSLGFPLVTYNNQVLSAVTSTDFLGGLVKAFVFGILIAGIGCLSGLQTKAGASAVGQSATRAVVSGIILIIVTDGVFSVAYHFLGF
jgi:phospholipid/cholesterol/gamma-HCH transport system permease protein